jgi:predicted MFS family arabinose efflux permease
MECMRWFKGGTFLADVFSWIEIFLLSYHAFVLPLVLACQWLPRVTALQHWVEHPRSAKGRKQTCEPVQL